MIDGRDVDNYSCIDALNCSVYIFNGTPFSRYISNNSLFESEVVVYSFDVYMSVVTTYDLMRSHLTSQLFFRTSRQADSKVKVTMKQNLLSIV